MLSNLLLLESSGVDLVGRGGGGEGRFFETVNRPGLFEATDCRPTGGG